MKDYKKVTLKNGEVRYRKTISLGFYPDGRRKQKRITAKTVKELRKLESEYMLGEKKVAHSTSKKFTDVYDAYLDEQSKTLQRTTIDMKRWVKKTFKPFFDRSVSSIKDNEITEHFEIRSEKVKYETVRHEYSILKAFFKWMYQKHIITENTMDFVKLPKSKETPKEMQYITEDDFWKMYQHIKLDKFKLIFTVMFYTGLRKGELCALSSKEIVDHELHLSENCQKVKGEGLVITDHMKTPRSKRIVPLPLWLEYDLKEYLEKADYPFMGEYFHIGVVLHRILEDAGLPDMRVHDMRHSYAALLISRDVDIYTVSKLMGHTSVTTTSKIYGHLYDRKRRAVANLLVKK